MSGYPTITRCQIVDPESSGGVLEASMVDPRERRLVIEAHLVDLDTAIHAGDWRHVAEEARYLRALLTQIEYVAERRMEEARRDQRR